MKRLQEINKDRKAKAYKPITKKAFYKLTEQGKLFLEGR